MRLALLVVCLVAAVPVVANDAYKAVSPCTLSDAAPAVSAAATKPTRFTSPEDYDLDQLLRCAVGCQG
jgi:hypothetical protein